MSEQLKVVAKGAWRKSLARYHCISSNADYMERTYGESSDDGGVDFELHDLVLREYADAALAAKDARIAELDGVLSDIVKLLAVDKKGAYTSPPVRKILDWSARAELAIASQPSPAPLAATPSEDGGEVPEVVAHRPRPVLFSSDGELLMTVAQHSRIVAAKDAEIARWKSKACEIDEICQGLQEIIHNERITNRNESLANAEAHGKTIAERDELRAQLARQVGGDEREHFEACAEKYGFVFSTLPVTGEYMDCATFDAFEMWKDARAALAPAAVLMPERKEELPEVYQNEKLPAYFHYQGYNAALDEIVRLNRRAIPVGLLNRLVTPGNWGGDVGFWNAVEELRALLGQD